MSYTRHRLFATLLALLVSAPALSEPVPVPPETVVSAPDWSAGSSWYYSDGYGLRVSSNSGGVAVFERLDAPGQWFSRQGFLRKDLVSGTATRNSIYRTLPDQMGVNLSARAPLTFQREYLSNGKLLVHASSWTVEGRETITVPAGTFDCWVIVWRTRSLKSDWTGFERWWYSPTAQNYVRMEYKYGPAEASSRVLMRYTLGQRADAASPAPEGVALALSAPVESVSNVAPQEIPVAEAAPAPVEALEPALELPLPPRAAETAALPPPQTARAEPEAVRAGAAPPADSIEPAPPRPEERAGASYVWRVQLASSKDQRALRADFDKILAANAENFSAMPTGVNAAQIPGRGTFYRAWVGAFSSAREAEKLCGALKAQGGTCAVMRARNDSRADG